jgi:rhamnogalacturonyl hydrolase YesR
MNPVSQIAAIPQSADAWLASARPSRIALAVRKLQNWIEVRDYAGYDPYDLLNSPFLSQLGSRSRAASWGLIQVGKRFAGNPLRARLRVPPSRNPKALGLMLAGYCDQFRSGADCLTQMRSLKSRLRCLRSPHEEEFCWGYDWNFVSLRGPVLPAFQPNAIATVFCGQALLDLAQATGDEEALEMAASAGRFIVTRLDRSVDTATSLCFSYTPWQKTQIYNSSALAAAFLARLGSKIENSEYLHLARRAMHYLVAEQQTSGSWFYGAGRMQRWIDGFHTGYNLEALLAYRRIAADTSVDSAVRRGLEFYQNHLFDTDGAPKYLHNSRYPIDIHCCSQAILTFAAFALEDSAAREKALEVAHWTLDNMCAPEGCFYYQAHRWGRNRTAYMRWGQAWMFRSLTRLEALLLGRNVVALRPKVAV